MITRHVLFVLALSAGCTKASTANETSNADNGRGAAPRAKATVTLTSVAFADDCGGTPPQQAPIMPARSAPAAPAAVAQERASEVARRRCEQTAMQLAIVAAADTAVQIKSVEVYDEDGKSLGTLTASKPTRWIDGRAAYEAWDEKLVAGETARASYVLSQPTIDRWSERDRTYKVKVVAAVGGVEQALQTAVMIVAQPPAVPT